MSENLLDQLLGECHRCVTDRLLPSSHRTRIFIGVFFRYGDTGDIGDIGDTFFQNVPNVPRTMSWTRRFSATRAAWIRRRSWKVRILQIDPTSGDADYTFFKMSPMSPDRRRRGVPHWNLNLRPVGQHVRHIMGHRRLRGRLPSFRRLGLHDVAFRWWLVLHCSSQLSQTGDLSSRHLRTEWRLGYGFRREPLWHDP